MIASGDRQARNAFRVALRDEPSRPNVTQELDPNDILEVQDVAAAIARAEERLFAAPRASSSTGLDVFDALVARRPTDDASGPALHAVVRPTPVPPPAAPRLASLASSADAPRAPLAAPTLMVPANAPAPDDDAYFHPAGRIRTLAEVTLDGYRPEPTIMMRIRARRGKLSWLVVAILVPLAGLAAFGLSSAGPQPSIAQKPAHLARPTIRPVAAPPAATEALAAPSVDVKSLPSAKR
jgi:hypothetical protein